MSEYRFKHLDYLIDKQLEKRPEFPDCMPVVMRGQVLGHAYLAGVRYRAKLPELIAAGLESGKFIFNIETEDPTGEPKLSRILIR